MKIPSWLRNILEGLNWDNEDVDKRYHDSLDSMFGYIEDADVNSGSSSGSNFFDSLGKIFDSIGAGISGFDWTKGVQDLMNYYTGGVTGAQSEAQRFNSEEAERQRVWEQEMSNTAFQRQTQDMMNAGVNPALMYGGAGSSGASTPSGSSASVTPSIGSGNLFDAIFQMASLPVELKYKKAQTAKLNEETRAERAKADVAEATKQTEVKIVEQSLSNLRATHDKLEAEVGTEEAKQADLIASKELKEAQKNGVGFDNFFKEFRKSLLEKYHIDPTQQNIPSALIAVSMAIADHIELAVKDTKEQIAYWSKCLESIAKSFGTSTARKINAIMDKQGGLTIEDSTFESWDYPDFVTD